MRIPYCPLRNTQFRFFDQVISVSLEMVAIVAGLSQLGFDVGMEGEARGLAAS